MATHYLYIDTNAYLTFFHFSSEDLATLKKLVALVKAGNILLLLPEQTKNEFDRNREARLFDSLTRLKSSKFHNEFPAICRSYPEYGEMQKAIKQFEQNKSKLMSKLQHDAETETLAADEILKELFAHAKLIGSSDEILEISTVRFNKGNPPGKDKSYGDAINWESLLSHNLRGEDLFFVSDDGDFYSKINSDNFNSYLKKEWIQKKGSNLWHYRKLTEFLKDNYPRIELSDEIEKDVLISSLIEASSFVSAKGKVRQLFNYDNFSITQLNDITTAFVENNQISWVSDEYPIADAIKKIIEPNLDKLDRVVREQFEDMYL